jgi:AraC-like DNA-binding protein
MYYNISKPSTLLSQYVKHYWSIDSCIATGKETIQRIVPTGLFELIFYLADKPQSNDSHKAINDKIIVTGQLKDYHDLILTGNLSIFAIYFLPHGLSMFLDLPIKEIFNQSIPLRLIIKDTINKLEDEISSADTFEKKISIAEKFLMSQIRKNEKKYKYDRIKHTIYKINQAKGIIDIEDLASQTFLSRKQFERTFAEYVGTSPKQFLQIIRFQNTIYEKSQNPHIRLTDLAYNCGYFDQAHMINEFKKFSGITPKKYFENEGVLSDYFGQIN